MTLEVVLLCAETTQMVRAQQGDYVGVVKETQAEIKAVVDDWIAEQVSPPPQIPPAAHTVEKSRGRLEMRELWLVPAQDLGSCLADVWKWHDVQQIGWVRRCRQI